MFKRFHWMFPLCVWFRSASEIIIFLFLGLSLASENHEWHTGFVLWTLLLCTVFRFLRELLHWWWSCPSIRGFEGRLWWICPQLHFFFKGEINLCTLVPLFGSVHSDSVNLHNCVAEHSLTSFMWAHSSDRFPRYAWTAQWAHSDFVGSKMHAFLGVTCHLHFWQNDQFFFFFTCYCHNKWTEQTPSKLAQKGHSGEENSPTASAGIWTCNLLITNPALYWLSYPNPGSPWAAMYAYG